MNIQQLEYLIAVDKYKHFGKAAQSCFITQPTLSAMIQKLEDELEVKIFDRTSHPIRTTDIGLQIVEQARHIMNSIAELKDSVHQLNNTLSGKINIGIISSVSASLLTSELFNFLNQHPKIEINIYDMTTDNIIRNLKSGELDAGIISTPHEESKDFFSDLLFNEELLIYSSDKSLSDSNNTQYISPKNLDLSKIWLLEEGNCLRKQTESICQLKENTLKPKNLGYSASNVGTLINMVDQLGGITIIPELATRQLCRTQSEKVFHFKKPFPTREISLIYYKPSYKQRILDELAKFIKGSLALEMNFSQNPENFITIKP